MFVAWLHDDTAVITNEQGKGELVHLWMGISVHGVPYLWENCYESGKKFDNALIRFIGHNGANVELYLGVHTLPSSVEDDLMGILSRYMPNEESNLHAKSGRNCTVGLNFRIET